MNKQQTLRNPTQAPPPKTCGTDLRGEDPFRSYIERSEMIRNWMERRFTLESANG